MKYLWFSTEKYLISANHDFHEILIFEEEDMRCPPDHTVEVGLLYVEVNIESVDYLLAGAPAQDVIHHLYVGAAFLVVLRCVTADLDPRGIEWGVLILVRADQEYVLEPFDTFLLTQLVEACFLNVLFVGHAQLVQDD